MASPHADFSAARRVATLDQRANSSTLFVAAAVVKKILVATVMVSVAIVAVVVLAVVVLDQLQV
jgi:hypothetical protein